MRPSPYTSTKTAIYNINPATRATTDITPPTPLPNLTAPLPRFEVVLLGPVLEPADTPLAAAGTALVGTEPRDVTKLVPATAPPVAAAALVAPAIEEAAPLAAPVPAVLPTPVGRLVFMALARYFSKDLSAVGLIANTIPA